MARVKPCPSFESLPSRVSEGFMCCPNSPTEKSNLDKSDADSMFPPTSFVRRSGSIILTLLCAARFVGFTACV
jgi:hypothetical protein